jgi:hypothetical protein
MLGVLALVRGCCAWSSDVSAVFNEHVVYFCMVTECSGVDPFLGLLTVPMVDGCTGPVTWVHIPLHALMFAETLRYGCGMARPITTRWLKAIYGRHMGKLSSIRATYT